MRPSAMRALPAFQKEEGPASPDGAWNAFSRAPSWARRPASSTFLPVHAMPPTGLEAVYLANRDKLLRFLLARGAGDAAEDLVHELWLKVAGRKDGPIANPTAYLFRAADTLMIDRYRARRQATLRDQAWSEQQTDGEASSDPAPDRSIAARQETAHVERTLRALGPRKEAVFRRARIDNIPQRQIAEELGISLSTVENDLRIASRALLQLRDDMA